MGGHLKPGALRFPAVIDQGKQLHAFRCEQSLQSLDGPIDRMMTCNTYDSVAVVRIQEIPEPRCRSM